MGSYSGFQSACRTPPPLPLLCPRIEPILLGIWGSGRIRWVDYGLISMMELTGATMAM